MNLINQYPSTVVVTDTPSGQEYRVKAGQVLDVNPQDVSHLLNLKHISGGCCGAPKREMQIFVVVEE